MLFDLTLVPLVNPSVTIVGQFFTILTSPSLLKLLLLPPSQTSSITVYTRHVLLFIKTG